MAHSPHPRSLDYLTFASNKGITTKSEMGSALPAWQTQHCGSLNHLPWTALPKLCAFFLSLKPGSSATAQLGIGCDQV